MSELRVANRYAKSLTGLASEQNKLDLVHQNIQDFLAAVANDDLSNLLKSPIINIYKKVNIVKEVFGKSVDTTTLSFFEIIIKKNRANLLEPIAHAFVRQYKLLHGIYDATLVTAIPLDTQKQQDIQKMVEQATGKKFEMQSEVDSSIIGGIILKMDDALLDASISSKLAEVKKNLVNKYII